MLCSSSCAFNCVARRSFSEMTVQPQPLCQAVWSNHMPDLVS
uniref:Uncharacterized protein n=1 Tax=Setaria italica TaxID=4555 RepID=K3XTZ8_SETIT